MQKRFKSLQLAVSPTKSSTMQTTVADATRINIAIVKRSGMIDGSRSNPLRKRDQIANNIDNMQESSCRSELVAISPTMMKYPTGFTLNSKTPNLAFFGPQ